MAAEKPTGTLLGSIILGMLFQKRGQKKHFLYEELFLLVRNLEAEPSRQRQFYPRAGMSKHNNDMRHTDRSLGTRDPKEELLVAGK